MHHLHSFSITQFYPEVDHMDKIDRKIISLLQENARYPLKYLAQKVFLSSPAVSTRIERLEKNSVNIKALLWSTSFCAHWLLWS